MPGPSPYKDDPKVTSISKVREKPSNQKTFKAVGGPQGSWFTELSLGDQNLLENAFGFNVDVDVNGIVELTVKYRVIDIEAELEAGRVKHELLLQKTTWRTNPVDGVKEKTPHREFLTVKVDGSLPEALRAMADKVEAEEEASAD